MLRVDIITIFPGFFREAFDYGIIRRARAASLVTVEAHDLRAGPRTSITWSTIGRLAAATAWCSKPEPIFAAVESLTGASRREDIPEGRRVVLLSPQGRTFNQSLAAEFAGCQQLVLICGRYEGVDERVAEALVTDEVSIGDYVLVRRRAGRDRGCRCDRPVIARSLGQRDVGDERIVFGWLAGLSALHAADGFWRAARAGSFVDRQSRGDRALAPRSCSQQDEAEPAGSFERDDLCSLIFVLWLGSEDASR